MSIRCRCLLVREGDKPIWSDKDLRLDPSINEWIQFEDGGVLSTFRVSAVMHTPGLEGVDFALVLTEQPGTRGRPFRDLFEEWAATGSTLLAASFRDIIAARSVRHYRGSLLERCRSPNRTTGKSRLPEFSRQAGSRRAQYQQGSEMWSNKLLSIVLPLIGLYVLIVGSLYVLQRPMIFQAGMSPVPPVLNSVPGFQEVSHRTEDGLDLRALYRPAAPGALTLVYFHGNADGLSGSLRVTERLAAKGYGLLLVGYRGYDRNPGSPSEEGLYADGRSALRWLSEHGVPGSGTVLVGNSLGSGPATEMAATHPVAGLVLISGYTSLPDVTASTYPFVPVRLLMRDRFDNIGKFSQVMAPILILHGTADRTIPYDHAVRLAGAAGNRTRLVPFEGIGHELAGSPMVSPAIDRWLSFLAR